jgi:transcription-repair coupling factor (superfamily II helicase)
VFVAGDDSMLRMLAEVMPAFLPDRPTRLLPAWDTSPYDRSRPSRAVTGTRVATLNWLAENPKAPALVLTTPEGISQRIPPAERLLQRSVRLTPGQPLAVEWLRLTVTAFGYDIVERVDEPGEAAIRPGAADVFPAGAGAPVRLELDDGQIRNIRRFDAIDQLSVSEVRSVLLLPASEGFTVPGEDAGAGKRVLPDGPLWTLFDLLPEANLALIEGTDQRIRDWLALVRDGYRIAMASLHEGAPPPAEPDRLYLREEEISAAFGGSRVTTVALQHEPDERALSPSVAAREAAKAVSGGAAAIICADATLPTLRDMLARRLRAEPETITLLADWQAAALLQPGQLGVLCTALRYGFHLPGRRVIAVQLARAAQAESNPLEAMIDRLSVGDLVVEFERGLAKLTGLMTEEQAGASFECLALEFRGGSRILVPAIEADRIWRYGASGTIGPDRLEGSAWRERREQTEREIEATAASLVEQMREREAQSAPVFELTPAYRRFVRQMPFAPTADQVQAIRAVQQDLAAGHPMLRLVCGDVGFGKTEIALHAAAIVALAGRQVAVAAPTTLLAHQHLEVFRRRLAGLGLRIEPLLRSARSKESRAVLRRLANGEVDIVVGTHAVVAAQFRSLALVVIDEEQRFGEAHKRALRSKRAGAHALIMTATPLPRTLQAGLVGVVGVSLLTQPPATRLPVRSVAVPFDPVVARTALMREARRGGQSFVVCPRIDDLAPMQTRLREIVPELLVAVAHGRMAGETLDRIVLEFAAGDGDILLTTNIIEAGLDIPNANTMLIWRADRFGLAQLHQLRGRIGRGRVRAMAYLLTDPSRAVSAGAEKRLQTVASLDQLGAGFAVSLADLEQRGAGDLLGNEQAGHIRLIGTELYRHVLTRALARARGEATDDAWNPTIVVDVEAAVPATFVPEPDVRLEIYRRLARLPSTDALDDVSEELADRFGDLPNGLTTLLDLVRLRLLCRQQGISAVHAGPEAVALTPRPGVDTARLRYSDGAIDAQRVILPIREKRPEVRLRRVLAMLQAKSDRGVQSRSE